MTSRSAEPAAQDVTPNTAVLLHRAVDAIERVVPQRLAAEGHQAVRTAHGAVFRHLDEEGSTVSALAERAGMTKQAMAELVAHLETHGYVRRVPDPDDRRAKLVQRTDSGREVVAIAVGLVPELEARIIGSLGRARWLELRADLETIGALFEHEVAAAPQP